LPATIGAITLVLITFAGLGLKGINLGVDFSGGTEAIIKFDKDTDPGILRDLAKETHIEGFSIQALEGGQKEFMLRYDEVRGEDGKSASASHVFQNFQDKLTEKLADHKPEVQQVYFVGPQVGKELRTAGILSLVYAILSVILYVAFRFDLRFSPGALIKMFIDVVILLGVYVFFGVTFDLVSVAAFLTVVGYSVNDTIVIYDRIRENLTSHPRRPIAENINLSINETLVRSINTSLTTALSLVGILIFASGQIWDFAMAMTVGIVVATLTSIFIASIFVLWTDHFQKKRALILK
jgi:preprotein translocase SecF subunit